MLWPNGWMDQDATGKGLRLSPNDIVLDGDPPPPRKGAQQPTFQPAAVARIRIDFHKVAFILKSNTEDCINVHWFLTKLQTNISWFLFFCFTVYCEFCLNWKVTVIYRKHSKNVIFKLYIMSLHQSKRTLA